MQRPHGFVMLQEVLFSPLPSFTSPIVTGDDNSGERIECCERKVSTEIKLQRLYAKRFDNRELCCMILTAQNAKSLGHDLFKDFDRQYVTTAKLRKIMTNSYR